MRQNWQGAGGEAMYPTTKSPDRTATGRGSKDNRHANYTTSPIDLILSRLDGVKQTGPYKWLARCPAHEDRSPSLSIKETETGSVLVHCFAGCSVNGVVAAIGLELSDLFPARRDFDANAPRPKHPKFRPSELFPLVVTEALILALAWRTVADGGELSLDDRERAELAAIAVISCWEKQNDG